MTYPYQFALHVIDWRLFNRRKWIAALGPWPTQAPEDFDFATDQREGW
jgi:hypothetical protein